MVLIKRTRSLIVIESHKNNQFNTRGERRIKSSCIHIRIIQEARMEEGGEGERGTVGHRLFNFLLRNFRFKCMERNSFSCSTS